ncbi:MAG: ABC transporter permease [Bacteroidaceae bacterium]|nr:ABC transporter permease [Bacteroidaceae bacterium]
MMLVWKLLRKHISLLQVGGFFLANLLGMLIVLLALQFYCDVRPVFSQDEGLINSDYLIVSKRITALGGSSAFSEAEIRDLQEQRFTKSVGAFTASQYRVSCSMGIDGVANFGTQMYFEAVPDRFVDTQSSRWKFAEGDTQIPIILPRSYLAIYNFGFAQSRSLPKISEGVVSMVDMTVVLKGEGREGRMTGKVIGFSNRLNTVLVPQSFIDWSNGEYAPDADAAPTRLIVEVGNPTDDAIAHYIQAKGYDIDEDKLDAGKTTYFLRVVSGVVMGVGLLISVLSFYILMLSIYLLVQKNSAKLQNLLLIGYSPARVSLPYQLLTVALNAFVLLLALGLLWLIRSYYMEMLWQLFPTMDEAAVWPALALGGLLFVVVSVLNVLAVRRKVMNIWNRKL